MDRFKKVGILLGSSVLSLGMFSSVAGASTPVDGQPERIQIQVASTDTVFKKEDLIKKFRELFPKQFDFLTANDFHMSNAHIYPNDDTLRHDLSFSKTVNGKDIYGNVGFVGKDLDIEYFHYQPADVTDALFPAKVSKEEAQKKAESFVKNFLDGKGYKLETDTYNYYPQQILTEPIRYSFSFARTENDVSIADQRMEVSVLGNGEIVSFYKMSTQSKSSTFDDVKQIKENDEMVAKVKEQISAELNYQINYDYATDDRKVQLVYQPTSKLQGVHAISGKWLTPSGYVEDFPEKTKIEMLAENPLPPKQNGITVDEAKKIAEKFLAIDSDKVKLNIESIHETENYNGREVISVQYMYQYANGGSGTNLEIDKQTGEVIQYHDIKNHLLGEIGEKPKNEKAISQQDAIAKAVSYAKEWVPSYLHDYAMPVDEPYFEEWQGGYYVTFPRIVNGIVVNGDSISVGVAADGSLNSLHVNYQETENWPSSDQVISEEEAKAKLEEALSLKLTYLKHAKNEDKDHYDLVYVPAFNGDSYSYLDANTGEWNNFLDDKNSVSISHPWAENELNYLISAKILDVKDPENFNADASITKGEALKIIMNSLTYFYDGPGYYGRENVKQTFDNIDPKHPLYNVVERAVGAGIIQTNSKKFDVDSPITREELAVWSIRALGFEQAAKKSNIYKLDFKDADKVQTAYTGYVALASSLGIIEADQDQFNPTREVTYAELAVSTVRLAHEIAENGRGLRY